MSGNSPQASFIDLERVSLVYNTREGRTKAVDDVSISVKKGEFVAVVGSSGCGKSSLLKLISGLHTATTGNVQVDGKLVAGPTKCTGMAFQNPTLLPWRTTLDNVLLPLEIVKQPGEGTRASQSTKEDRARELLAMVGLSGFETKYPWELSGGMQQRGSLCRALIHDPQVLLLDEPFGALDVFTREELWSSLQSVWMKKKPTVMLVTHDLREAVFLADTIYVMSNRPGRIISRTNVELPRPRTLENTYLPEFIELTHKLRSEIAAAKAAAAA